MRLHVILTYYSFDMSTFNIRLRSISSKKKKKDSDSLIVFFIQRNAALSIQELRNPGVVRLQKVFSIHIKGRYTSHCFNACCTKMLSMSLVFQYDTKNVQKPH